MIRRQARRYTDSIGQSLTQSHGAMRKEAAFHSKGAEYPDESVFSSQVELEQSHVPTVSSYCLYSWHSVSRLTITLAPQPQTLKELVPLCSWQKRLSPIAVPSAKS